jgi:hypothetical protein
MGTFSSFINQDIENIPAQSQAYTGALQRFGQEGSAANNELLGVLRNQQATQPNSPLLALAASMFSPTKTGSFGEALGSGINSYSGALTQQRQLELDRAMKINALRNANAKVGLEVAQGLYNQSLQNLGLPGQVAGAQEGLNNIELNQYLRGNLQPSVGAKTISAPPPVPAKTSDAGDAAVPPAPGPAPVQTASAAPTVQAGQPDPDAPSPNSQPVQFQIPGQPQPGQPAGAPAGGIGIQDVASLQQAYRIRQLAQQRPDLFATGKGLEMRSAAEKAIQDAAEKGFGVTADGRVGYIQGSGKDPAYLGGVKGAETAAQQAAEAPYKYVTRIGPGGQEIQVPLDQQTAIDHDPATSGLGANVSKESPYTLKQREQGATDDATLAKNYTAIAPQIERLNHLKDIVTQFQTGNFAEQKANLVGALRAIGFNVPNTATANPAAFQQFMKEATAEVFEQLRSLPGQPRVAEIQGLQKALMDPNLQPEANAAIIGETLGLLQHQKAYYEDYRNWRKTPEGQVAPTAADFQVQWEKDHPLSKFIQDAKNSVGARGEEIPRDPGQRKVGKVYVNPQGKRGLWTGSGWQPVE